MGERFRADARQTGAIIAQSGLTLVSGGGRRGLMAEAIEGALTAGGETIGVLPGFMIERRWNHPRLTRTIVTDTMHERKQIMAEMAVGVIALAGGVGTFEELLEAITWHQLGLFPTTPVILNTAHYYDPLIEMLRRTIDFGFGRERRGELWLEADTPRQAVEMVLAQSAK